VATAPPTADGRRNDGRPTDERATDGRTARSQRTRDSVVAALEALLVEGAVAPSAAEIAERAGVSTRSIYVHFASIEDLFRAVVERTTRRTLGLLTPIDPGAPLEDRITEISTQRSRVNEEIGPLRRAAVRQEGRSPTLAESRALARDAARDQVHRIFARELAALDEEHRAGRAAAADALLSGETWDLLRTSHGLSRAAATAAVADGLRRLLSEPPHR
jgi:AcrR family transcriptional regulator